MRLHIRTYLGLLLAFGALNACRVEAPKPPLNNPKNLYKVPDNDDDDGDVAREPQEAQAAKQGNGDAQEKLKNEEKSDDNKKEVPPTKPPVIAVIPDKTVQAGKKLSVGILIQDPEDNEFTTTFRTEGGEIEEIEFSNGLLDVAIPEDAPTATWVGIVKATDTTGASAERKFKIYVQGKKEPSTVNKVINATCEKLEDPVARAACNAGGSIIK